VGTGGYGVELGGLLLGSGHELIGYVGPRGEKKLPSVWLGDDQYIQSIDATHAVLVALGAPRIREKLSRLVGAAGCKQECFVHGLAWVSPAASIGGGSVCYPHACLHEQVKIGNSVLINSNASIGHETQIGNYTNIGPGASVGGCCTIGDRVQMGIGASMREGVNISDDVIIGAGAAVVNDIDMPGTYVGVPAKELNCT